MTPTWLLLEVTAILTLALAGVRLARRSRAAVRHVLLAGAFAVLLVLPFASIVMPAIRVEVPASVHAAISPLDLEFDAATIDDAIRPAVANAASNTQAPAEAEGPSWSWPSLSTLLLATWITGTALFLVPVLVGLWQVRMLRRSGLPWRSGGAAVGALANDAGIHRGIDVLLHESVPGPMTCGVLHPAIVLPNDAERWAPEDLTRAIVHELEHVRRVDWISHCLARIVAACYWFHPIVWIAWRQLVLEAERACDDAVLRRSEATAYADQLVELAQRLSAASSQPQLAMANRRDLHTRVLAVLDSRQRRGRAGVAAIVVAIAACALLVMTMSPLRIVAASVETVQDPSHKFDVVSIKPCPGLPPPGSGRMVAPQAAQTSPGYVHWSCISLAELIDQAYARPDTPLLNMNMMSLMPGDLGKPGAPRRIRGGPSWIESDRWAIEAKASGEAGKPAPYGAARYLPPAMNDALKAMLADRFQLKLRRATEQQPMYALTVAKGGLKLTPATPDDCFEMIIDAATGLRTKPPGSDDKMVCGVGRKFGRGNSINEYRGQTLEDVARNLSSVMDRFVLDQTGVDTKFTFTLKYTPDDHTPSGGPNLLHAAEVGRAAGAAIHAPGGDV